MENLERKHLQRKTQTQKYWHMNLFFEKLCTSTLIVLFSSHKHFTTNIVSFSQALNPPYISKHEEYIQNVLRNESQLRISKKTSFFSQMPKFMELCCLLIVDNTLSNSLEVAMESFIQFLQGFLVLSMELFTSISNFDRVN